MAFCNSCGASLTSGTKFCNKCGAAVPGAPAVSASAPASAPPASAAAPPPASTGGSSALKVVLIVIAVIVAIGILGVGTIAFVGYRIAKSAHVTQHGDTVKVDTPLGSFSANDPEQASKDLGVDVYPGAEVQKDGSADMTLGKIHTVAAVFQTSDSLDKVCDFYKLKFQNAMVRSSDQNHCNIVSNDKENSITINVEPDGGTTKIQITHVTKKGSSE